MDAGLARLERLDERPDALGVDEAHLRQVDDHPAVAGQPLGPRSAVEGQWRDLGNAIDATDVPSRAAIAAPSVVSLRAVKVTEPPGDDLLGDEALSPPEASH
jgi:hypothetical protein